MSQKIEKLVRRADRDWTHSSGGTMYVFEVTTDDGIHGLANAKSETPWYEIGTDVVAKIRNTNNGENSLKIDKPEFQGQQSSIQPNTGFMNQGNAKPRDVDASIAASWAIDHAMKLPMSNITIDTIRDGAKQLMELQHELKIHYKERFGQ